MSLQSPSFAAEAKEAACSRFFSLKTEALLPALVPVIVWIKALHLLDRQHSQSTSLGSVKLLRLWGNCLLLQHLVHPD